MTPEQKFLIITSTPGAGLFSSFIRVLGHLHYCKKNNFIPAVFFSNNWVYWSHGGYNGSINGWEYYFSPVSDYSATEILNKDDAFLEKCNIFDFDNEQIVNSLKKANKHDLARRYDPTRRDTIKLPPNVTIVNTWPKFHLGVKKCIEENRVTAHELITEFVTIHPNVIEKVDDFYKRHFKGRKVVGVHMRGEEHSYEIEGWHNLAFASEQYYMNEVDLYLKHNPSASIFIATDTETAFNRFKKRYGEQCLFYDAKRSPEGTSPHLVFGGAEVGEEMLIEALLLSRADFFIHGISNVAFGILSFNPYLLHIDVYENNKIMLKVLLKLKKLIQKVKRLIRKLNIFFP